MSQSSILSSFCYCSAPNQKFSLVTIFYQYKQRSKRFDITCLRRPILLEQRKRCSRTKRTKTRQCPILVLSYTFTYLITISLQHPMLPRLLYEDFQPSYSHRRAVHCRCLQVVLEGNLRT